MPVTRHGAFRGEDLVARLEGEIGDDIAVVVPVRGVWQFVVDAAGEHRVPRVEHEDRGDNQGEQDGALDDCADDAAGGHDCSEFRQGGESRSLLCIVSSLVGVSMWGDNKLSSSGG